MSEDLLALEQQPAEPALGELYTRLFRAAHSMKGAAMAVEQKPIEELCHSIEDALELLRSGELPVSHDSCSVLLSAVDVLAAAGNQLREGGRLDDGRLSAIAAELAQLASGETPSVDSANSCLGGNARGANRRRWLCA